MPHTYSVLVLSELLCVEPRTVCAPQCLQAATQDNLSQTLFARIGEPLKPNTDLFCLPPSRLMDSEGGQDFEPDNDLSCNNLTPEDYLDAFLA